MPDFDIICACCHKEYTGNQEYNDNPSIFSGQLFVTHTCPHCSAKCNQCILCNKKYFVSKKNQLRNIKNHISQCHKDIINQPDHESTVDNTDPFYDANDCCRDMDDEEAENIFDQLGMDNSTTEDVPTESEEVPTKSIPKTTNLDDFNVFSNVKSNVYFWQEYACRTRNECHGGVRGIVWRSMYKRKLYDHTKLTSLSDARLLFNMTQHVMTNTAEQNDSFFDILEEVLSRSGPTKSAVSILTN